MTVTVKLDAQLEEQLRQRAAGSGRTTSDVLRAALVAYLEQGDAERGVSAPSAFELGAGLFGRHAGSADLASRRKAVLEEAWAERHAGRQARRAR